MLNDHRIAIIGAGNIGRALIGGLLRGQDVDPARIHATRRTPASLPQQFPGIRFGSDNAAAVADATIVVLAVKPQNAATVTTRVMPAA